MFRVFSSANPTDVYLRCGYLEECGIAATVTGESLAAVAGEVSSIGAVELLVHRAEDVSRAERLLAEFQGRATPTHCGTCGYDLTGLQDPRCPECGTPFPIAKTWTCSTCGEVLDAQFSECWKCAGRG